MTGQAHWLTLFLFIGFAGAITAYLYGTGRALRRYRAVRRGFHCPRTDARETGVMVRDTVARRWTGVTECSARVPGQPCSLGCVKEENAAQARRRAERAATDHAR